MAFGLFNRDNTFFTDFFHGFRNDVADGRIVIGGNRAYLCDLLLVFGGFGEVFEFLTTASTAVSIPRFRSMGATPAATIFTPSRNIA